MKMYVVIRKENLTNDFIYCGAPCMSLEEAEQIIYSRITGMSEVFPSCIVEYSMWHVYYYYIREIII